MGKNSIFHKVNREQKKKIFFFYLRSPAPNASSGFPEGTSCMPIVEYYAS